MSKLQYSEPLPILRSFESEGKRYVYGYACIFDSPDLLNTVISRQIVEASLPHLKKFPAVRFMHRIPFGQIVFNETVKGIRTKIDSHGFYVLCQIYDQYDKEWNMISKGGWGFSYGLLPAKDGVKTTCLAPNECYDTFVKGTLYEISIVDTPAHPDAIAHVVQRILNGHNTKTPQREKKFTMHGFDTYEIIENPNGTKSLSIPEPEPKQAPIPEPEPEWMTVFRINEAKRREKQK